MLLILKTMVLAQCNTSMQNNTARYDNQFRGCLVLTVSGIWGSSTTVHQEISTWCKFPHFHNHVANTKTRTAKFWTCNFFILAGFFPDDFSIFMKHFPSSLSLARSSDTPVLLSSHCLCHSSISSKASFVIGITTSIWETFSFLAPVKVTFIVLCLRDMIKYQSAG